MRLGGFGKGRVYGRDLAGKLLANWNIVEEHRAAPIRESAGSSGACAAQPLVLVLEDLRAAPPVAFLRFSRLDVVPKRRWW